MRKEIWFKIENEKGVFNDSVILEGDNITELREIAKKWFASRGLTFEKNYTGELTLK